MARRLVIAIALLLILFAADARRDPALQLSARAAVSGIHLYQATLARLYKRAGVQCRFTPSCSHYGEACIRQFGVARGGWMAMKRVLRCGPWTPMGTVDPPPPQTSGLYHLDQATI